LIADVAGVPAFGEIVGPAVVQDPGTGHTFTQTHAIGHTYTLTSNLLLDQVLGFTRQSQNVLGEDFGTNWGSEIFGIPGTNGPDERQSGMPNFTFGYSNVGLAATWMPLFRVEQSFTHDTNVNYIRGAHDLRFGFNLVRHHLNHWQPEIENPRGAFNFGGGVTALPGGAAPNFHNQFAAFLLGLPTSSAKSLQFEEMTGREWQMGWYFRDRWQATRRLTLTLGVRLDYYPMMTRRNTGLERLDPETMLVYLGGRGNVPQDAGISINNPLWAPRVGFAYRVTDTTVIRSG
jgi:outer membrane receptor protein involved in Fe transport